MKLDKKIFKYSSASIILVAVVLLVVILLNLIVTLLTDKFNLFVDLTEEQLYEISDASFELLSDMGDEEVKFIFLSPLDELDGNEYSKSVKTLALEYEEKFDNITIEHIDMIKNPGTVAKYRKDYPLSATSVIVESAKRFVVFDMSECFVYQQDSNGNYQYYAFNGEYRFTSSLIRVTRDDVAKAVFVTNHAETVPTYFKALLTDAGFDVISLDLEKENIPEDAKLLIVNAPKADFTGLESEESGISEITKLSRYLEGGGNAMIFVDPDTPVLQNLGDLMQSWGIKVEFGYHVVDTLNSIASMNSYALITRYSPSEDFGIFHQNVSSGENPLRTISYFSAPITLLPVTDVNLNVGTILSTYATSYVPVDEDTNLMEGSIPVLVASSRQTFDAERAESVKNYLVVGSSTYLVSDVFLGQYQTTFANAELIKNTVSTLTDEAMLLSVSYKVYNDTTLTIDTLTSRKWLVALVFALPAVVLVASFAVYLKRRHL